MIAWGREFTALSTRFAGQPFVHDARGATAKYDDIFGRAGALAAQLLEQGLVPGTPVATLLPHGIEAVWASLGVTLCGACEVPLNIQQSDAERRRCLSIAKVRHMVVDAERAAVVRDLPLVRCCMVDELQQEPLGGRIWPVLDDGTWGRILFTSGTTGEPKGAVHTHRGRWLANLMLRAHLPFTPRAGDNLLLMTPFSHGSSLLTYAWMGSGGEVTLVPGADPGVVLPLLRDRRVNSVFAPPTVLAKLVAALGHERLGHIRAIFCGTATLSRELYRSARKILGPVVRITYGMTEIFNPITVLEAEATDRLYGGSHEDEDRRAFLGWPASGVEIDVRDEAGNSLAPGQAGEVHVRAPHAFAGYLSAEGFGARPPDAYHATGDIGTLDATGLLLLAGRMNDVIKSGGYKVYPQEVEERLAAAAPNGTVVVVGLPSPYWGEVIAAIAEHPAPGWRELALERAQVLSGHKRPRLHVELPELPRNAIGKVNRKAVIDAVLQRFELLDGPHPVLHERTPPTYV